MDPRRIGWRVWAFAVPALAIANVILLGVMLFVPALPEPGSLGRFADDAHLDYRLTAVRRFTRLTDAFVRRVLGVGGSAEGVADSGVERTESRSAGPLHLDARHTSDVSHSFTNDDFAKAYAISSLPFTARTDTRSASSEPGEPTGCAPTGGTAWYRYTPRTRESVLADTFGSAYPLSLGIFTGTRLASLELRACDRQATGNAQAGLTMEPGTTYLFQVTGPAGGGTLVFHVARAGLTERVSLASDGMQADASSTTSALSRDGRYVAFTSSGTNLGWSAGAACAGCTQIFVRDRLTGKTVLESVSTSGQPADATSYQPASSDDGRYLAFVSEAGNLGLGPTVPGVPQVYVRDRLRRTTEVASMSTSGAVADGASVLPSISADGRRIVFTSWASNLRPNGGVPCGPACVVDAGGQQQVYVRDRVSRTTRLASGTASGEDPNNFARYGAISGDGRHVAFASVATNIVSDEVANSSQVYERDLDTGRVTLVSSSSSGEAGTAGSLFPMSVSRDGRIVAFLSQASNLVANDGNGAVDAFVHDRVTGRTTRVSVSSSGQEATAPPTETRFGAGSNAAPIVPVCAISDDGRFVTFNSLAPNLVPRDVNGASDVFVHDVLTGGTTRVSVSSEGAEGSGPTFSPAISRDGTVVAFQSSATNLVRDDSNASDDVFTHENELAR